MWPDGADRLGKRHVGCIVCIGKIVRGKIIAPLDEQLAAWHWKEAAADEQGIKTLERQVLFARPFPRPPAVAVALSGLDSATGASATAAEVSAEGFLLRLGVRRPGAVDALWIAHPAIAKPAVAKPAVTKPAIAKPAIASETGPEPAMEVDQEDTETPGSD